MKSIETTQMAETAVAETPAEINPQVIPPAAVEVKPETQSPLPLEKSKPQSIKTKDIRRVDGLTVRESLDESTVEAYTEQYLDPKSRKDMPPIIVWEDSTAGIYTLVDGWHRFQAAGKAQLKDIRAEVVTGSREQVLRLALEANAKHGHRMTRGDVKRAVQMALADAELAKMKDRQLARCIGTTHPTVAKYRRLLSKSSRPEDLKNAGEPASATAGPQEAAAPTEGAVQVLAESRPEAVAQAQAETPAEAAVETAESGSGHAASEMSAGVADQGPARPQVTAFRANLPEALLIVLDDGADTPTWYTLGGLSEDDERTEAFGLDLDSYRGTAADIPEAVKALIAGKAGGGVRAA